MSAPDTASEGAAHIVQLALTPIFLLSGIAALLSVFAIRYGRVADQAHALDQKHEQGADHDIKRRQLWWRSRALDCAVVLAALAAASTCGAALILFLGAVSKGAGATLLYCFFGGSLVLTVAALVGFVLEMLLAARGVRHLLNRSTRGGSQRRQVASHREEADVDSAEEGGEASQHDSQTDQGDASSAH